MLRHAAVSGAFACAWSNSSLPLCMARKSALQLIWLNLVRTQSVPCSASCAPCLLTPVQRSAPVLPRRTAHDRFFQLNWRPRPPSLLSEEKQKEIVKNLRKYSKRYEEEDEALLAQVRAAMAGQPAAPLCTCAIHGWHGRPQPPVVLHGEHTAAGLPPAAHTLHPRFCRSSLISVPNCTPHQLISAPGCTHTHADHCARFAHHACRLTPSSLRSASASSTSGAPGWLPRRRRWRSGRRLPASSWAAGACGVGSECACWDGAGRPGMLQGSSWLCIFRGGIARRAVPSP